MYGCPTMVTPVLALSRVRLPVFSSGLPMVVRLAKAAPSIAGAWPTPSGRAWAWVSRWKAVGSSTSSELSTMPPVKPTSR